MVQQLPVPQQAKSVSVQELLEMIDNVHFQHAWEDGWEVYNYCPLTGNTWLTKTPESPFAGVRLPKMELLEVAQKMLMLGSQTFEITPEVRGLLCNKTVAAKVLSWDQFVYGSVGLEILPESIKAISIQHDIVWYKLANNNVIPLGIEQFISYHNQIKVIEAEKDLIADEVQANYDPIPALKAIKESGDDLGSCGVVEVWADTGSKAGYVIRFGDWFYAIHEVYKWVQSGGYEPQYSWSRHSSFSLAESDLLDQLLPW